MVTILLMGFASLIKFFILLIFKFYTLQKIVCSLVLFTKIEFTFETTINMKKIVLYNLLDFEYVFFCSCDQLNLID